METITIEKTYNKEQALSYLMTIFNRDDTTKENIELFKRLREFLGLDYLKIDSFINLRSSDGSHEQYSELV